MNRRYIPNELQGTLRIGDKVRTNMSGLSPLVGEAVNKELTFIIDKEDGNTYEGRIDRLAPVNTMYPGQEKEVKTISWYFDSTFAEPHAWVEIVDLNIHGKVSQEQQDEILRLRRIETQVKSLMS